MKYLLIHAIDPAAEHSTEGVPRSIPGWRR